MQGCLVKYPKYVPKDFQPTSVCVCLFVCLFMCVFICLDRKEKGFAIVTVRLVVKVRLD